MFSQGDEIVIDLVNVDDQPPYRLFGTFVSEDDEYMKLTGTVGDDIGKTLVVPKTGIKLITIIG